MEVESKTSFGGMESKSKEVKVVTGGKLRPFDLLLPTLPPMDVPVTAKWRYLSAFVFCLGKDLHESVQENVLCGLKCHSMFLCGTVTVAFSGEQQGKQRVGVGDNCDGPSDGGAALLQQWSGGAIGLMGYEGNSRVRWGKVCNVFGKFCNQVAVALGLSFFGGLAFFLLVVMAAFALNKRH
ncbi:CASP-like protein 1E2 [Vitis vinifera]|uniref:CASP-like protein n=1 Tax=Vitis vinifera TaxID=29760 RepID=A0A438KLJ7_VITVI|nr:CASP-like protein 1E2 [Vitis vinifera]